MNETDPLILYTDASTVSIGGVLMQEQNRVEKPIIFTSHILSDQATRWGIMELALYAFVYCVKQLTPNGQTIYSEDGPQEPRLSREFFDSKVGESYFRSSDFSFSISRA